MHSVKSDTQRDYAERVMLVLVHIQKHLGESLNLDELARIACFSPFHFHRIFRGMVGESVKQHVKRLRLERAAVLLKSSEKAVTEIAFDTGYQTHESFTRAFRGAFSCSPTEFRKVTNCSARIQSPAGVHLAVGDGAVDFTPLTGKETSMSIEVRQLEQTRVAFLRHVGPYDRVGKTWERLCDWAGPRGVFGPDTRLFGASHDDPEITLPDKLRYDACLTVDVAVEGEGEIGVQVLGGGEYAVALHEGPYSNLGETYAEIYGRWLPAEGREPGPGPCLEYYLNDPSSTEPEDLLTEVCVPLLGKTGPA